MGQVRHKEARFDTTRSSAWILVTDRCSLGCRYCDEGYGRIPTTFDEARFIEIADAHAAQGTQEIIVGGGEPMLHPDLPAVIGALAARGFPTVALETNGLALSRPGPLEALVAAGLTRVYMGLPTLDPALHRTLTGVDGAIPHLHAAMDAILDKGLELLIKVVVTRATLDDLPATLERLAEGHPTLSAIQLTPVFPTRKALSHDLVPSLVALRRALTAAVIRMGDRPIPLSVDATVPFCLVWDLPVELHQTHVPPTPGLAQHKGPFCGTCAYVSRPGCNGLFDTYRDALVEELGDEGMASFFEDLRGGVLLSRLHTEALALDAGLRQVWRQLVPHTQVDTIKAFHARSGYTTDASDFRITKLPSGDLSHDPEGSDVIVYVGTSMDAVARLKELERLAIVEGIQRGPDDASLHTAIGELLGYPACCIKAFNRDNVTYHEEGWASRGVTNNAFHVLRAWERSTRHDPHLDVFFGARDLMLVSHFPCRLDCPASSTIARRVLEQMAGSHADVAGKLIGLLTAVVIVMPDDQRLLVTGEVHGDTVTYSAALNPVAALRDDTLYPANASLLTKGDTLVIDRVAEEIRVLAGGAPLGSLSLAPSTFVDPFPLIVPFGDRAHGKTERLAPRAHDRDV